MVGLLSVPVQARFASPQATPVDRLAKNIAAYVRENPNSADAYYLLGRIHGLAFRYNRGVVGTYGRDQNTDLPRIARDHLQDWLRIPSGDKTPPLNDKERTKHLAESITNYAKAIQLDPVPAHYHLGLAFVLDKGRDYVAVVPPPNVRTMAGQPTSEQAAVAYKDLSTSGEDKTTHTLMLKQYWREAAIAKYHDAFERAREKDSKINHRPLAGLNSLVSYEAGNGYLALIETRERSEEEVNTATAIRRHLEMLKTKRRGPITPIVFSLERRAPLADLLAPDRVVRFDLDGDGIAEPRPWVAGDTAILVWDPLRTGDITSGKQLLGSVTFHLYPGDGYTAMNLLDDDRDGELSGDELRGLAIWRDGNADGVSNSGEVTPIERTAISGLLVKPLVRGAERLHHPFGLRLNDGRRLPTYDWVAPAVVAD
jgi:hypothetical protein